MRTLVASGLLVVTLAACAAPDRKDTQTASMMTSYRVVDEDGRRVGTVTLSPLGSGEVRDSSGALIGRVVPPRTE